MISADNDPITSTVVNKSHPARLALPASDHKQGIPPTNAILSPQNPCTTNAPCQCPCNESAHIRSIGRHLFRVRASMFMQRKRCVTEQITRSIGRCLLRLRTPTLHDQPFATCEPSDSTNDHPSINQSHPPSVAQPRESGRNRGPRRYE